MAVARIGISGWTYGPWRGTFYPKGLPHKRELEFASRQMNSIEINGTFYSMQRPRSFQNWYEQTPDDFVVAVKGSRFITHMKKLRDVETATANFFAQGILHLREKLGPILWQFGPNFGFDEQRFEQFFRLLPRDTKSAAALARKHDQRLEGRSFTRADANRRLRYAVEVRHESFKVETFIRLLRKHRIALCVADTAGRWPFMEDVTADFVYLRLHGEQELYVSGYDDASLERWAARVRAWRSGSQVPAAQCITCTAPPKRKSRDVYVYFDNDAKVRAPFDAMSLARKLDLQVAAA
jgi:uncharacterized protein YecE (DUF72 family)